MKLSQPCTGRASGCAVRLAIVLLMAGATAERTASRLPVRYGGIHVVLAHEYAALAASPEAASRR